MKKLFGILVFFLCIGTCFAQKFNEADRLQKGDLTLLDENTYISDFALARMDNAELRLLRNMIYAKHGHTFNSKDLQKFFSQFKWYVPNKKVSDSEFSKTESYLIKRIQSFELRNENQLTLKFGNEIIGLWHQSPVMPDTWCDRFLIYPNNKIEFLISYFKENPEVSEYLGYYEIKGNVLIFFVNKVVSNKKTELLDDPLVFKFPITKVQTVVFGNGELVREMIQIGGFEYFLYDNNPETMGEWARSY